MRGTVFHGPHDVRVERVPDPAIKSPTDAIVRITRAAICGSDLHFYHGRPPVAGGFVLGHEGVGVVEETGSAIRGLRKGQRVVISATVACGQCFYCRRGQVSQCVQSAILGYGPNAAGKHGNVGGAQAEAICVPCADYTCFPLPDSIDDDRAAFLADILPTAYFGAVNGEIRPGDVVAVFGCGPVGLCAVMTAQLFGPAEVIAVDTLPYRLELAKKLGALPAQAAEAQQIILARSEGRGADVTIEAVGSAEALNASFGAVRGGGTVSMIGVYSALTWDYPMSLGFRRNLTFRVGLADINAYIPVLARLIEHGKIDPKPLISHVLPLDEAARGYRVFDEHTESVVKVLLKP
ncbi:MAG TPA: alcohol dehydrogenase catalytic domain-containing protein [Candidatus Binataceae bacterium]|nr:alcohol dehydrogenase catalytic domain-containing protein [Candidatus Binataceae bacterium]